MKEMKEMKEKGEAKEKQEMKEKQETKETEMKGTNKKNKTNESKDEAEAPLTAPSVRYGASGAQKRAGPVFLGFPTPASDPADSLDGPPLI